MEAAEAAQQEVLALQEQNVELAVRALREWRSAIVIHTLYACTPSTLFYAQSRTSKPVAGTYAEFGCRSA